LGLGQRCRQGRWDADYGEGVAGVAGRGEDVEGCEGEMHFGFVGGVR